MKDVRWPLLCPGVRKRGLRDMIYGLRLVTENISGSHLVERRSVNLTEVCCRSLSVSEEFIFQTPLKHVPEIYNRTE